MEVKKKKALIVNQPSFSNVGGIETYLYNLIKFCIKSEIRVIWLSHPTPLVCESFEEVLLSNAVERVPVKSLNWHWFKFDSIPLKKDERYVIYSCTPQSMCEAQDIILRYPDYDIFPVYVIANTTGSFYYLERYFKTALFKRIVFSIMKKMIYRWELNNSIRFFAAPQAKALGDNYGIEIHNVYENILRAVTELAMPDFSITGKRYKQKNRFIILTVGRLCFPHKGYMLGLVRTFGKLQEKYQQLNLYIIGSGQNEDVLLDEIKKQPLPVQKAIKLIGEVSPDKLASYYQQSDLNISVAGAAARGAAAGTLTIIARNFCESNCEVYGFYDDCSNMIISTEKGNDVEPYIIRAIEMSDNEYMNRCIRGYEIIKGKSNYNPSYLFDSTDNKIFHASKKEVLQMKVLKRLIKINHYLRLL